LSFPSRTRAKARALAGAILSATGMASILASAYLTAGSAEAAVAPPTEVSALAPATPSQLDDPQALTAAVSDAAQTGAPAADSRELDCLSTAVYYEARGETSDGQAAVAQVILNRASHPAFPKTVCGVVYQGAAPRSCQFSFVCNGAMHHRREPGAWERARSIAARALGGYVMAQVGGATCFHAARIGPGRGPGVGRVIRIGGQVFYGDGGRGAASRLRGREYVVNANHSAGAAGAILKVDNPVTTAAPVAADLRGVDASFKGPITVYFGS